MRHVVWSWRLLWSKSFLVATDDVAACYIPLKEPNDIEEVLELAAQEAALLAMRDHIDVLLGEHDEALKLLKRRQRREEKV